METIIATIGSSFVTGIFGVIVCVLTFNSKHDKEKAEIEEKINSVNANYDKQSALITQRIETLTEHVNQHNNLIDRMYNVEALTVRLQDMLNDLREDDRR